MGPVRFIKYNITCPEQFLMPFTNWWRSSLILIQIVKSWKVHRKWRVDILNLAPYLKAFGMWNHPL